MGNSKASARTDRPASVAASAGPRPLGLIGRAVLAIRVWTTYVEVRRALRRHPLPIAAAALAAPAGRSPRPAALLSRAVTRALRVGPWQSRCLVRSLVLFRMLRAQGTAAELVIGLPSAASDADAHAWVELEGRDLGPAPGRHGHEELVRYPQPDQR
jgi:hypothetical protein